MNSKVSYRTKKTTQRRTKINKKHRNKMPLNRGMFNDGIIVPARQGYVPTKEIVSERYADSISTGVIVLLTAYLYEFNLNSTFDPDKTGVGHQPYGRDNLVLSFNRYRPLYVKWHISFPCLGTAYEYVVCPYNGSFSSSGLLSALQLLEENPRSVKGFVGIYSPTANVKGRIALWTLNGVSKAQYLSDDRFQATGGASPTESMTLAILIYNPNGSSINVTYNVRITYTSEWFDPVQSGISSIETIENKIQEIKTSKISRVYDSIGHIFHESVNSDERASIFKSYIHSGITPQEKYDALQVYEAYEKQSLEEDSKKNRKNNYEQYLVSKTLYSGKYPTDDVKLKSEPVALGTQPSQGFHKQ